MNDDYYQKQFKEELENAYAKMMIMKCTKYVSGYVYGHDRGTRDYDTTAAVPIFECVEPNVTTTAAPPTPAPKVIKKRAATIVSRRVIE